MIDPRELRIGNIVEKNGVEYVADFITIQMAHLYNPILLTHERLMNFGFTKYGVGGYYNDIFILNNVEIADTNRSSYCYQYNKGRDGIKHFVEIKFLHHIQNLFFSLTGEELDLVKVKKLNKEDFLSIGGVPKNAPCTYHGRKIVYRFEGHKDSDSRVSDGVDTHFNIELADGYKGYANFIIITKVCVGGFGGVEHKEQIFKGIINNKSELEFIIQKLGIHSVNLSVV